MKTLIAQINLNLMIDKRDIAYKTLNERKKSEYNLMKKKLNDFGEISRNKSPNNNENIANTLGDSFLTTNKNIKITLDEFIPMKNSRSKIALMNKVKIPTNLNNKTYKNNLVYTECNDKKIVNNIFNNRYTFNFNN